jgi:hypothetical protein
VATMLTKISSDPLPEGHASRLWGVGIEHTDGAGATDPDPRANLRQVVGKVIHYQDGEVIIDPIRWQE